MKTTVSWQQDMLFKATTPSGHTMLMDGEGNAPSPMEAVLVAAGACSSIDVVEIMKKARQNISHCECDLNATRAEQPPRVFTAMHAHYRVRGDNISEKHLARAVQLSAEKYCSVLLMLEGKVAITTSYEIQEA